MTSHSQAAVTVYFDQVGDDIVATWTGSLDLGSSYVGQSPGGGKRMTSTTLYYINGMIDYYDGGVATEVVGYQGAGYDLMEVSDFSAGFDDTLFFVGGVEGVTPTSSFVDFDAVDFFINWRGYTLESHGAESFYNTLAWTSSTGDTVSYTTVGVPEPSSTALIISLGALALAVRRRR